MKSLLQLSISIVSTIAGLFVIAVLFLCYVLFLHWFFRLVLPAP